MIILILMFLTVGFLLTSGSHFAQSANSKSLDELGIAVLNLIGGLFFFICVIGKVVGIE